METIYITSAMKPEQLPDYEEPEIAFIGRSNTGKSTLLNALLGRQNLARHSRTPGRTQMVNFFGVGGGLILADLPGYGFSMAAKHVHGAWQELVEAYVRRPNIKEFLFLIDSRRELNDEDLMLMFVLGRQLPLIVVMTKVDKLSKSEINQRASAMAQVMKKKGIDFKEIVPVSSTKKVGLEELRERIFVHLPPKEER